MRRNRRNGLLALVPASVLLGFTAFPAAAQTPAPPAPSEPKTWKESPWTPVSPVVQTETKTKSAPQGTKKVSTRTNPIVLQYEGQSPQIVTVLHRLSGLKVIRQLLRYNNELGAIAKLDEAFKISHDVHTNVIAGLALDDGETIAAWLPEASAEMPPPNVQFSPRFPTPAETTTGAPRPPQTPEMPTTPFPGMPSAFGGNFFEAPDLRVITRDGKRLSGRYVGLDGVTGISVISLPNSGLPKTVEAKSEVIVAGQRLRVIGPQPAPVEPGTNRTLYFRVGQTDATVVEVSRSPSGALARIKIKAPKLTAASMGSIAINDAGETVGIIDQVQGSEASIVPVSVVRKAAKRVMDRQASVPRPWLGVRGEPIGALSAEKIQGVGWKLERAKELADKRNGILLTSVIPGSPAARNKLKPGDVILSVNNEDICNGEQFAWWLQEAGPGNEVHFVIAHPYQTNLEALKIELSESPDPLFGRRIMTAQQTQPTNPGSLMAQGIETIAIKPKVAMRFGATGGLLVVYVQPSTAAFKAGLRPGDVIEAIDGQQLLSRGTLLKNPGASSTFNLVRNKQKLSVTISTSKPNAE